MFSTAANSLRSRPANPAPEPLSKGPEGEKPTDGKPEAADATSWGDAEGEIAAGLGRGDFDAYLAHAKKDPGFPFEPLAVGALNRFAKGRPADWHRLRAQLKTD